MHVSDLLPGRWAKQYLQTDCPTGLGYDVATTEGGQSNPSSLTVMQKRGPLYLACLILRWKSSSEAVHDAILDRVVSDILDAGIRPKALSIDASNEVFHAQRVRNRLLGKCPCHLIKSGAKIHHRGVDSNFKTLLGDWLVAYAEDNMLALPDGDWVIEDFRLVKRDRGSYRVETGIDGGHGDCFDSTKLALWSLEGSHGNVDADAASITAARQDSIHPDSSDPLHAALFGESFGSDLLNS